MFQAKTTDFVHVSLVVYDYVPLHGPIMHDASEYFLLRLHFARRSSIGTNGPRHLWAAHALAMTKQRNLAEHQVLDDVFFDERYQLRG